MKTGFRGTFVISWSQTEVDGLDAAPVQALDVGASWSWRGDAVRVDGPSDILKLGRADGAEILRKRAARTVHRLVGDALDPVAVRGISDPHDATDLLEDSRFVITDGAQSYTGTLIDVGHGAQPLVMFLDELPPRGCDMWVVRHTLFTSRPNQMTSDSGVICFTPGTRISTPTGDQIVDGLRVGDLVQTKDNGPQSIKWIGCRRMTGARLFAMPALRPVRIRTGALGVERPDQELLVSPEHRMLLKGPKAQALFNTTEVLVAAKHLIDDRSIVVDHAVRDVTYIHVLLSGHNVVWANGVETESFHPANADLMALATDDRTRLLIEFPSLEHDPYTYGGYARRNLTASEAAIFTQAA